LEADLHHINIADFTTESGALFKTIQLSYQVFGKKLGTAPVVLINHALTGNSNVAGKNGWWQDIVGEEKLINTNIYSVLSFNIPGNGFDGQTLENYRDFIARDMANIFLIGLNQLKIQQLYALIGGSLGGGIAWEMVVKHNTLTKHFIPIATDWKATDWLIANCQIQEQLLVNSKKPVHDARMHAMLCYRSPASFRVKFNRSKKEKTEIFNVESWLLHHGKKLQDRFQLASYKLMNQLLKTIDASNNGRFSESDFSAISAAIHIVSVNSDLFFTAEENRETYTTLSALKDNVFYHEIDSVHGHDAFLIEYNQLRSFLKSIF
jgi:homoserine O-acetyltransferase